MRILWFLIGILFCGSLSAQWSKKQIRLIEKSAVYAPADTLRLNKTYTAGSFHPSDSQGRILQPGEHVMAPYEMTFSGQHYFCADNYCTETLHLSVGTLYFASTEVSNVQYRDYTEWIRENRPDELEAVLPDTTGWRKHLAFGDPFMLYYFRHPAYNDYPVVNVSHAQAKAYMNWLTEQYNQSPDRKYKQVIFRLPSEAEWVMACRGGHSDYVLTNAGRFSDDRGRIRANFKVISQSQVISVHDSIQVKPVPDYVDNLLIHSKSYSYDNGMILTPCESYWKNSYGIWNMMGNAAEFVAEEGFTKGGSWNSTGYSLMPLSRESFDSNYSSSPTRGFRWVMEVVEK